MFAGANVFVTVRLFTELNRVCLVTCPDSQAAPAEDTPVDRVPRCAENLTGTTGVACVSGLLSTLYPRLSEPVSGSNSKSENTLARFAFGVNHVRKLFLGCN